MSRTKAGGTGLLAATVVVLGSCVASLVTAGEDQQGQHEREIPQELLLQQAPNAEDQVPIHGLDEAVRRPNRSVLNQLQQTQRPNGPRVVSDQSAEEHRNDGLEPIPEAAVESEPAKPKEEVNAKLDRIQDQLLYTTYFYTASEAIIHGFENDTEVRIISMQRKGTVYQGKVDARKTIHVSTGPGVFSFVANKKCGILVGTPSSCTVVGYWLRDPDGSFRADTLFTQLPSSAGSEDCRVVVWAWDDVQVTITDATADKQIERATIAKGTFHQITRDRLSSLGNHILEFRADQPAISVQVYYDEGYLVPGQDGRGAGRLFYTYVGKITEGTNDLNLISHYTGTKAKVEDIVSGETIWEGEVPQNGIHTLNLAGRYVRVTANVEISVLVAPYEHYKSNYAEHHFGVGSEGLGIENRFLLTTPGELWVFSYYDNCQVKVFDAKDERLVWEGLLHRGHVQGVHPGHGFYRVESSRGVSVMGGAMSCGAEFSPASGLFQVDEALFEVVQQIREQRIETAREQGVELDADAVNAPLSEAEAQQANKYIQSKTNRRTYSNEEVQDRLRDLNTTKQE